MRLIDADKVLERLQEWNTSDKMDKALYNFARNRIVEQPTAYNRDKVVEQLEEIKNDGIKYQPRLFSGGMYRS